MRKFVLIAVVLGLIGGIAHAEYLHDGSYWGGLSKTGKKQHAVYHPGVVEVKQGDVKLHTKPVVCEWVKTQKHPVMMPGPLYGKWVPPACPEGCVIHEAADGGAKCDAQ